jgi:hypothetical protein
MAYVPPHYISHATTATEQKGRFKQCTLEPYETDDRILRGTSTAPESEVRIAEMFIILTTGVG